MALLQPRAPGLDEADHRRARLAGEPHHPDDRLGVRLAQRAAHEGRILGVAEDRPPAGHPGAGEHAVAGPRALPGAGRDARRCAAGGSCPGRRAPRGARAASAPRVAAGAVRERLRRSRVTPRCRGRRCGRRSRTSSRSRSGARPLRVERARLAGDVVEVEPVVGLLEVDRRRRDRGRVSACTVATASTAPAAPSRWPIDDFSDETGIAAARSPNTRLIASVSERSLSGVEVPWALT